MTAQKQRLVIRYNIKHYLPKEIRLGKGVAEALDKILETKIKEGCLRTIGNKRTTLMPQDL